MDADVVIVGGGPAGATCAAHCARSGLRVIVLERTRFPREKVCGDTLNPNCWSAFDRLGISEAVGALPHGKASRVEYVPVNGRVIGFQLSTPELCIKRSRLDEVLLRHAGELGAEIIEQSAVTGVAEGWKIQTESREYRARILVAADGRNSTVARLLGMQPAPIRDRVGLQAHVPLSAKDAGRIQLHILPFGYCGTAPVSGEEQNICLVSHPGGLSVARAWAEKTFAAKKTEWRTITPIRRKPIAGAVSCLYMVGDTARVVEPFTGEGIYYALATGELAARHIIENRSPAEFIAAHDRIYRGRLWANRLARLAVLHPEITSKILRFTPVHGVLKFLTKSVVAQRNVPAATPQS